MIRRLRSFACRWWPHVALAVGSTLILVAAWAWVTVTYGWPAVDWPDLAPSTPYTVAGVATGLALLGLGGWLLARTGRSARRRRRQSSKRPRAVRGGARGPAAVPSCMGHIGGDGAAATQTFAPPSPAAKRARGGRRAGRSLPRGFGRPASSRRRLTGGRQRRAVAAEAWDAAAATTATFPATRDETWTWPDAVNAGPRNEITARLFERRSL